MKKIMFNDKFLLTQAVLDGRKTQTRRIVKFNAVDGVYAEKDLFPISNNRIEPYVIKKYSMYNIGEIVAIAQSYRECGGLTEHGIPRWDIIAKAAGSKNGGWANKMFVKPGLMPHQIRITDVRVERLQDISDECCLKEGIIKWDAGQKDIPFFSYPNSVKCDYDTPQEAFAHLINKVSRKDVWEENPYVFVYDFELVK